MSKAWILVSLIAGSTLLSMAQGVPAEGRLTARELFFVPAATKQMASAKPVNRPTTKTEAPAAKTLVVPQEVAKNIEKKRKAPPANLAKTRTESQIVQAGYMPENLSPLGMRYTIVKRVGSSAQEVPADTAFRSGDRIQVAVETNESGYLYIVTRGSSGAWKPLFPSKEVDGGSNYIEANTVTTIPAGHVFTFDEQAGEEKLFLVFSRQPEPNLENLIYDLGTGATKPNGTNAAPKASPVTDTPKPVSNEPKTLLAMNVMSIGDDVVGNLRRVYARDLVVEKVQENATSSGYGAVRPLNANYVPNMDIATYVVNPSSSKDARVVADLSLVHR